MHHHEIGRFHSRPGFGEWMLNTLILADRAVKNHTFVCIMRRSRQCVARNTDAFTGHQDAFGIQPVQNLPKAFALLPDQVLSRNRQSIDEDFVRIDSLSTHLFDLSHVNEISVEICIEQAQPFGRAAHILKPRCSGQKQHLVCHLRGRNPDFLSVHDISVPPPHRHGLQLCGIQPRRRFGHGETGLFIACY